MVTWVHWLVVRLERRLDEAADLRSDDDNVVKIMGEKIQSSRLTSWTVKL
jgi:hypothetical protein